MKHTMLASALLGGVVTATGKPLVPTEIQEPAKPNFVFIMADDLGWKDVGFNGNKFYETPNIDRISQTGMTFDRAYSCGPNCLPTRACIISGMYTPRTQIWTPGGGSKGKAAFMKLKVPLRGGSFNGLPAKPRSTASISCRRLRTSQAPNCRQVSRWTGFPLSL